MFRFSSLSLVAAYAVSVVLAAPQTTSPSESICAGYQWGVTIQQLLSAPDPVYDQYVIDTSCGSPAWVTSSSLPDPPTSISPWGVTYDCDVPVPSDEYYCGQTLVATCCGKLA